MLKTVNDLSSIFSVSDYKSWQVKHLTADSDAAKMLMRKQDVGERANFLNVQNGSQALGTAKASTDDEFVLVRGLYDIIVQKMAFDYQLIG